MDSFAAARHLGTLAQGEHWPGALIRDFVNSATLGAVDTAQVAAFLMATARNGLSGEGLHALTMSYVESGITLSRSPNVRIVDKHSTGGIGDKLTFIVCPLVAAAGGRVRKMSGKSLGHCAGTIDKLSAIPGFRHELEIAGFLGEVERFGFSIVPQSEHLCPADALTYAIRDRCGSTGSADLIAASIMSKKIATGANSIVLDVKLGAGGLFSSDTQGIAVAHAMLKIAAEADIAAQVYITDMTRPLGTAIGGIREAGEALRILENVGDADLTSLALEIASTMLRFTRTTDATQEACRISIRRVLEDGSARQLFREWLEFRGADWRRVEASFNPAIGFPVYCKRSGWVSAIRSESLGMLAKVLGSLPGVSGNIQLLKSVGDFVSTNEVLAVLDDGTSEGRVVQSEYISATREAFIIGDAPPTTNPRILNILEGISVDGGNAS